MRGRPCTCCFTGHRPEKLPWGSDESDPRCTALKKKLSDAVEAAYEEGMRHFICGMARGCDFYFAEAVIELRRRKGDVSLEAAVPCLTQAERWPEEDRLIYTGQYRINALDWASSYTGLHEDGYVDVFRADVQYRVHDGAAPEGMTLVDGWANMDGNVYLAVFHDGGSISGTKSVTTKLENGWIGFAGEVA